MAILNEIPVKGRILTVLDNFPGHGTVLRRTDARDGAEIPLEAFDAIQLDPEFVKVPAFIICRIRDLFIKTMEKMPPARGPDQSSEVSVVLLRDEATQKIWRCLVPEQFVGKAFVQADYERPLVDIVTGERIERLPLTGWLKAGTSHSHNTFGAFFSGTDNRNELPQNGIHFIFGNFHKNDAGIYDYNVCVSVVYHHKRYTSKVMEDGSVEALRWDDLLLFSDDAGVNYACHDDVHANVHIEQPANWDTKGFAQDHRPIQIGKSSVLDSGGYFTRYGIYDPSEPSWRERERAFKFRSLEPSAGAYQRHCTSAMEARALLRSDGFGTTSLSCLKSWYIYDKEYEGQEYVYAIDQMLMDSDWKIKRVWFCPDELESEADAEIVEAWECNGVIYIADEDESDSGSLLRITTSNHKKRRILVNQAQPSVLPAKVMDSMLKADEAMKRLNSGARTMERTALRETLLWLLDSPYYRPVVLEAVKDWRP